MSRVEWVDGPPEVEQIHNERIRELLPELIARPGEWAIVETGRKWHSARQAWVRKGCQASARREDDGTYTPGRDAAVSPDAQTNYILGCDHDGDKALCYMLRGDVNGAVAELDPGLIDPSRYGVDVTQGPLAVASAVRDRAVRRRFVDGNPLVVVGKAGPRLRVEAKAAASNAIVANLADMARIGARIMTADELKTLL